MTGETPCFMSGMILRFRLWVETNGGVRNEINCKTLSGLTSSCAIGVSVKNVLELRGLRTLGDCDVETVT